MSERSVATELSRLQQSSLKLDLCALGVTECPDELRALMDAGLWTPEQLAHLDLSANRLESLPDWFSRLSALMHLDLSRNSLSDFPPQILSLPLLSTLLLRGNNIDRCPAELAQLPLKKVDLRENRLLAFPEPLLQLKNLEVLLLDGNEIDTIPRAVEELHELQVFTMNDNKLLVLPVELASCAKLRVVSVYENPKITVAPVELVMSPRLEELHCNNALEIPQHILTEGASKIIPYLRKLAKFKLRLNPKAHWVPDSKSRTCSSCHQAFTFTNRRHHCRVCGLVYCAKCCSHSDIVRVFHTDRPVRTCVVCHGYLAQPGVEKETTLASSGGGASGGRTSSSQGDGSFNLTPDELELDAPVRKRLIDTKLERVRRAIEAEEKAKVQVEKLKGFYANSNDAQGSAQAQRQLDSSTAKLAEYRSAEGELLELQHALLRQRAVSKRGPAPPPTGDAAPPAPEVPAAAVDASASPPKADTPLEGPSSDQSTLIGVRALALYDFVAEEDTALSFHQDDVLTVLSQDQGEWWYAALNGAEGYVPFNFLRIMD